MPMTHPRARQLVVLCAALFSAECSATVSPESVYGTYVASYRFGKATLKLNHDQSFVQEVTITGQPAITAKGSWTFEPNSSEITLHGAMAVTNGFGELNADWRRPQELSDQPVELMWFRVIIEMNPAYPYIKQ